MLWLDTLQLPCADVRVLRAASLQPHSNEELLHKNE
jgi:hypothetical protein